MSSGKPSDRHDDMYSLKMDKPPIMYDLEALDMVVIIEPGHVNYPLRHMYGEADYGSS